MIKIPLVSICIPVYYSGSEVLRVLDELLTSIETQTYPRIQTCVSIQETTRDEATKLRKMMATRGITIALPRAEINGPAKNTNYAMSLASDEGYIKLMNQDDFFNSSSAISDMVYALEAAKAQWLISSCVHTDSEGKIRERYHLPAWPGEKGMVECVNRFGCPSVAMFDAVLNVKFDSHPDICYAMDCDFWIQLYRMAGPPILHLQSDVVIRMWDAQLSSQTNIPQQIEIGKKYMRGKYGYK